MITGLLPDETPHPDEVEIWAAIKKASNKVPSDGKSIMVGIRNDDGTSYRVVASDDMAEMMDIADALIALGFKAEYSQGVSTRALQTIYDRTGLQMPPCPASRRAGAAGGSSDQPRFFLRRRLGHGQRLRPVVENFP